MSFEVDYQRMLIYVSIIFIIEHVFGFVQIRETDMKKSIRG